MALTYEPVLTYTFPSAAGSYTFNSIPQTYTDLVLILSAKIAANPGYGTALQFNSDTAANYSLTFGYGTGSTVASNVKDLQTSLALSYGTGLGTATPSAFKVHIMSYTNTSFFKPIYSRASNFDTTYGGVEMLSGMWKSTAAITSITLLNPFGSMTFATGGSVTLYGIKGA